MYFWAGDYNAGTRYFTFYEFIPPYWLKNSDINYGLLFWQCIVLAAIVSCNVYVFRTNSLSQKPEGWPWNKAIIVGMPIISVVYFFYWLVHSSLFDNLTGEGILLCCAGLCGLVAPILLLDSGAKEKPRMEVLGVVFVSIAVFAMCMCASCWRDGAYDRRAFRWAAFTWRLLAVLIPVCLWLLLGLDRLLKKYVTARRIRKGLAKIDSK